MANLNLICGIPGSGKSSWLQRYHYNDYIVSRDDIRFSLLQEEDGYFDHEKEVFVKLCQTVDYYGAIGDKDVWVDQTSLNARSRGKLLRNIQKSSFDEINAYYILVPYDIAVKRNSNRKGRKRVPNNVIGNMLKTFTIPSLDEGFDNVYQIEEVEYGY